MTLRKKEDEENYIVLFFRILAIPFVKLCLRLKWSPNETSLFGGALWLVSLLLIFLNINAVWNWVAFLLFVLAFIFDCVDGMIARLTNRMSDLGLFLDKSLDNLRDILLYLLALYMGYTHTQDKSLILFYVLGMAMWAVNQHTDVERRVFALKKKAETNIRKDLIGGKSSVIASVFTFAMRVYYSFDHVGLFFLTMFILSAGFYPLIKYIFLYMLISKFFRNAFSVYSTLKILKKA